MVTACCAASTAALAQSATPATTLSTLTPGESWLWSLSGSIMQPASSQAPAASIPLSGTMFEQVEVLPFQGNPTLALVSTDALSAGGMSIFGMQAPPAAIFYVQQDPTTNTVFAIGDNQGPNGALRVSTQPAEFTPGQWSSSTSYDTALVFPNGTEPLYLNVTGTTTVATPAGDFAAWVAPNGATDPTGVTHIGTDYWTPELGAPALFNTTTTDPTTGATTEITGTLLAASILGQSTSVPEPASLALLGCGLLGLAVVRRRSA